MRLGANPVLALRVGAQMVQKAYLGSQLVWSADSEFSPASLFANGEQGLWYDVSDLSTLFQNTAGTVPVTAVEQPVGLILDKRLQRFNGPTTGWTKGAGDGVVTVNGNLITITGATTTTTVNAPSRSMFNGQAYLRVRYVNTSGATSPLVWVSGSPNTPTSGASALYVLNSNNSSLERVQIASGSATFEIQEYYFLPGNHASQPTTTARAWLRARYNLYLNSETLSTQNVTVSAGQHRLRFEGAGTITLSGAATGTFSAGTHTAICTAGTLTSTVSGVVTRADLRAPGIPASLPPYQRIAAATDYDTVGFPVYLDPDGTDDGYQTGSIDFTGTDKMTIWAGLRKVDDAVRVLCELSAAWFAPNGAFLVLTGAGYSSSLYSSGARGTGLSDHTANGRFTPGLYPAPDSAVLTAQHDIAGDLSRIRRNGSSAGAIDGTGDKGTGNFGNHPLYLFSRGGTSLRFKGPFYYLVIRGAATDTGTIEKMGQVINSAMKGVY